MAQHTVVPGDCFCSLAEANGFFDYATLYNHGTNAALKGKRPNPNQLAEGDVVSIPDKQAKKVPVASNKEHKFVVVRTKTKLRLKIVDYDDRAIVAKTCELVVGKRKQKTLPSGGIVEMEIDPTATSGTLSITWAPPPAPAPAPAPAPSPAPSPPPYPPKIVAADFDDKPEPVKPATAVKWTLHVGSMEPFDTIRGALRRLNNLGGLAPDALAEDDASKAAVKAHQRRHALTAKGSETGKVADVQADLRNRHDTI